MGKKRGFPLELTLNGAARQATGDGSFRPTVVLSQLLTSRDRAALAALFTDEAASPGGFSQTAYVTPHLNINNFPFLHLLLLMQSFILPSFPESSSELRRAL